MTDYWSTLDPLEIENFIEADYKTFIQSIKQIKILQSKSEEPAKFQALLDTLETQKLEISQFKQKVPLLLGLKRQGMGERHWREIIQRTKINVNFEKDFNF